MLPTVPQRYRGIWKRAMRGAPSLSTALRAKCLECANFNSAEIADCTVYQCPLWLYRVYGEV